MWSLMWVFAHGTACHVYHSNVGSSAGYDPSFKEWHLAADQQGPILSAAPEVEVFEDHQRCKAAA